MICIMYYFIVNENIIFHEMQHLWMEDLSIANMDLKLQLKKIQSFFLVRKYIIGLYNLTSCSATCWGYPTNIRYD